MYKRVLFEMHRMWGFYSKEICQTLESFLAYYSSNPNCLLGQVSSMALAHRTEEIEASVRNASWRAYSDLLYLLCNAVIAVHTPHSVLL